MKLKYSKWLIAIALFFSIYLPVTSSSKAATTSIALATSNLNVRSNASLTSKKVGELKKGSIITVYTKTNSGWSEIRYKKRKAYVFAKYLQTSYQMDSSKVYTYKDYTDGKIYTWKFKRKDKGWDLWDITSGKNERIEGVLKEDIYGIYNVYGGTYSENVTVLKYPLKVGKYWNNQIEAQPEYKSTITSINKTIKTPAGTFKNVVEVKDGNFTSYYAPNIGFIVLKEKGKVYEQLIKISKR